MNRFYWHWRYWALGATFRLNGDLMWGFNPYTSYRFGPLEYRRYHE